MSGSSTDASLLGTNLGDRYLIERLIARGGMGEVYEAEDRVLRRQVAVKVYRADALADRSRFDAEVRILAALNHPSLVQVYDAGQHDGDAFVVLELVDGPTLASRLATGGPLPSTEVAEIGVAMAGALAHVHDSGVVHRDVTPSNILCGADGRPRLADFGIARLLDATRLTAVTHTVGTAAYMAPEQVQGAPVTAAADVYSLGLVLLEALTGRPAFDGVGHEVALARLTRQPDVVTDVPSAWHTVLGEMTARAPEDRPGADALAAPLAMIAATPSASSAPTLVVPVGGGAAPADGIARTGVMAPPGGGTAVMPLGAHPETIPTRDHRAARAFGAALARGRGVVLVAAGLLLVVALALAAMVGGGGEVVPDTSTTVPTAVTVASTTPTTITPTTGAPRAKGEGAKKHGKGG